MAAGSTPLRICSGCSRSSACATPDTRRRGWPGSATGNLVDLARSQAPTAPEETAAMRARLFQAAEQRDLDRFRRQIAFVLTECAPLDAVENHLAPVLAHIGDLWAAGRIDVGAEHALSEVVLRGLRRQIDALHPIAAGPRVGFATLGGEQHELGALMACYLAAAAGRSTLYVGSDLPAPDLTAEFLRNAVDLAVIGYALPTPASRECCSASPSASPAGWKSGSAAPPPCWPISAPCRPASSPCTAFRPSQPPWRSDDRAAALADVRNLARKPLLPEPARAGESGMRYEAATRPAL